MHHTNCYLTPLDLLKSQHNGGVTYPSTKLRTRQFVAHGNFHQLRYLAIHHEQNHVYALVGSNNLTYQGGISINNSVLASTLPENE